MSALKKADTENTPKSEFFNSLSHALKKADTENTPKSEFFNSLSQKQPLATEEIRRPSLFQPRFGLGISRMRRRAAMERPASRLGPATI
jgi:hypothetical protein